MHNKAPGNFPTPAGILNQIGSALSPGNVSDVSTSSSLLSVSQALSLPPIHVEHVAQAICTAVEKPDIRGVVGVRRMRELIGWREENHGVETNETKVPIV